MKESVIDPDKLPAAALLKKIGVISSGFEAAAVLTRAQAANAIHRLLTGPSSAAPESREKGSVYGGGDFRADEPCAVGQFLLMMNRAMGYAVDQRDTPADSLEKARKSGLLEGISEPGNLARPLTGDFAARILYNALHARWESGPWLTDCWSPSIIHNVYGMGMDGSKITFEKMRVGRVPLYAAYKDDGVKKPFVLVLHGLYENKEATSKEKCYALAEEGFFAVCIDAYAHGERADEPPLRPMQIEMETAKDIDLVIEHFQDVPQADTKKLGITGFSMGGSVTHYYTTHGKYHPVATAPMSTTADTLRHITPDGSGFHYHTFSAAAGIGPANASIEEISEFLREADSFSRQDRMSDVAILLQCGSADESIDPVGSIALYESLAANPNQLYVKLYVEEGAPHAICKTFVDNMIDHFNRWLK